MHWMSKKLSYNVALDYKTQSNFNLISYKYYSSFMAFLYTQKNNGIAITAMLHNGPPNPKDSRTFCHTWASNTISF